MNSVSTDGLWIILSTNTSVWNAISFLKNRLSFLSSPNLELLSCWFKFHGMEETSLCYYVFSMEYSCLSSLYAYEKRETPFYCGIEESRKDVKLDFIEIARMIRKITFDNFLPLFPLSSPSHPQLVLYCDLTRDRISSSSRAHHDHHLDNIISSSSKQCPEWERYFFSRSNH